ncbi:MAG: hypothetical protein AAB875_00235 [Patescibacteria group bacterium]
MNWWSKGGERKMKESKAALIFGTFMALMHAFWSLLVFLGLAQPYLNFISGLHFLNNPYKVLPFNLSTALMLVAVTFVIGYLVGAVFAKIWNKLRKG